MSISGNSSLNFSDGRFTQALWVYPQGDNSGFHGVLGLENGLAKAIQLKLEPKIIITSGEGTTITVPSDPPRPPEPDRQ